MCSFLFFYFCLLLPDWVSVFCVLTKSDHDDSAGCINNLNKRSQNNAFWLVGKKWGENIFLHITCGGTSHGEPRAFPALISRDNSDGCLFNVYSDLSVVASRFFFFFLFFPPFLFNFSLVIKVVKLDTLAALCFHLVVTVTQKHRAVVNEIPPCHQSLADKEGIVVAFWRRSGGGREGGVGGGVRLRQGALCGLDQQTLSWNLDVCTASLTLAPIQFLSSERETVGWSEEISRMC